LPDWNGIDPWQKKRGGEERWKEGNKLADREENKNRMLISNHDEIERSVGVRKRDRKATNKKKH
jgi:hypothetical protein